MAGTSIPIKISGQSFKLKNRTNSLVLSDIESVKQASCPQVASGDSPSGALYQYRNVDRDFTFQKICPPLFGKSGSIARYTGLPANEPDFISQGHFIGLMRIIDHATLPDYQGVIGGTTGTAKSS